MALDYSVPVECFGKVAFVSWDRAHAVSKRSRKQGQKRGYAGSGMGVYRCPCCRQWHIGARTDHNLGHKRRR